MWPSFLLISRQRRQGEENQPQQGEDDSDNDKKINGEKDKTITTRKIEPIMTSRRRRRPQRGDAKLTIKEK